MKEPARLELDEAELARYARQLSAILDHMASLRRVDTHDVSPTAGLAAAALRPDESRPGLSVEELLKNAPETEAGQFKIPPVFED